jgi:hypothetical protein
LGKKHQKSQRGKTFLIFISDEIRFSRARRKTRFFWPSIRYKLQVPGKS